MRQSGSAEGAWFDRFYQCLIAPDRARMLVLGIGLYPNRDAIDGYACLLSESEQRNLRFGDRLGPGEIAQEVGPVRWEVPEPGRVWRSRIGANSEGFELDGIWTARNRAWVETPIVNTHESGPGTEFAHFSQPGRWSGELRIDGESIDIEGWHDPVYRGELEMTGQVHALNYLKQCRGGAFVPNPV